jgi:hypothetical protein
LKKRPVFKKKSKTYERISVQIKQKAKAWVKLYLPEKQLLMQGILKSKGAITKK